MAAPAVTNLDTYNALDSARQRMLAVAAVLICLMCAAAWVGIRPFPSFRIRFPLTESEVWGRFLFIVYAAGFTSMWLVYFSSTWDERMHVRSLRVLLRHTALNWSDPIGTVREVLPGVDAVPVASSEAGATDQEKNLEELDTQFKAKATTSLQNLGILTAVAAFELGQVVQQAPHFRELEAWQRWTIGAAILAVIAAYVMFIVSADALDTMFNRFRGKEQRHLLIHYFYDLTRNRRYLGFVFLLFSATLLVAFFEPWLGVVSLGVIMAVGYPLWFPEPRPSRQNRERKIRTFGALGLVGIPLILWAHF